LESISSQVKSQQELIQQLSQKNKGFKIQIQFLIKNRITENILWGFVKE
jgi:hypothetical protein